MMFGGARNGVDRHQLGGPTNGRLYEGNIGGDGSDEGTAGGESGNYGEDGSGTGGSDRDSDRFNSGGGSDPDPVTRRVDLSGEQRRAFSGQDSDLVDREVSVGDGSVSGGDTTVSNPSVNDIAPGSDIETGSPQVDVVDRVTSGIGNAVDFVTSGPNEPSVGDPEFSDPGTTDPDTTVDVGGGNGSGVDPDRPSTGIDQGLVDNATDSGGIVAENTSDSSAVLPGEIAGVDISENRLEGLAEAGENINERISPNGTVDAPDGIGNQLVADVGSTTADAIGNTVQGAAELPGVVESTAEFGQNAPLNLGSVQTAGSTATAAAAGTVRRGINKPGLTVAELGIGAVTGTAAGRAAGAASRTARQTATRVGNRKIEAGELVNDDTLSFYEGETTDVSARFPGATDKDLYQTDPAAAVRQQADANTPDEIAGLLDEATGGEGTDLKKAIEVDPEGPDVGRGNTGFRAQEGDYESPGSFFGPELSPNFLGLDEGRSFSLRPGLPDTGSSPTAVVARTEVETADADTLDGFNQELLDAEGDTTARTKPASEVNPGEAEAVVPPTAEFAPVRRGGAISEIQDRLGLGGGYYTEIDGQPVRLQTAADPDLVESGTARSFLDNERAQASLGGSRVNVGRTRRLSELRRRGDAGTDRPLPTFFSGSSPARGSSSEAGTYPSGIGSPAGGVGESAFGISPEASEGLGSTADASSPTRGSSPEAGTSPSGIGSPGGGVVESAFGTSPQASEGLGTTPDASSVASPTPSANTPPTDSSPTTTPSAPQSGFGGSFSGGGVGLAGSGGGGSGGSVDDKRSTRPRPFDLDLDERTDEGEFDIDDDDRLFGSGILSGEGALESLGGN